MFNNQEGIFNNKGNFNNLGSTLGNEPTGDGNINYVPWGVTNSVYFASLTPTNAANILITEMTVAQMVAILVLMDNVPITVTLTLDDYPEEIDWFIFRKGDFLSYGEHAAVLKRTGTDFHSSLEDNSTYEINALLTTGTYILYMIDSYGDGWAGPIIIRSNNNVILNEEGPSLSMKKKEFMIQSSIISILNIMTNLNDGVNKVAAILAAFETNVAANILNVLNEASDILVAMANIDANKFYDIRNAIYLINDNYEELGNILAEITINDAAGFLTTVGASVATTILTAKNDVGELIISSSDTAAILNAKNDGNLIISSSDTAAILNAKNDEGELIISSSDTAAILNAKNNSGDIIISYSEAATILAATKDDELIISSSEAAAIFVAKNSDNNILSATQIANILNARIVGGAFIINTIDAILNNISVLNDDFNLVANILAVMGADNDNTTTIKFTYGTGAGSPGEISWNIRLKGDDNIIIKSDDYTNLNDFTIITKNIHLSDGTYILRMDDSGGNGWGLASSISIKHNYNELINSSGAGWNWKEEEFTITNEPEYKIVADILKVMMSGNNITIVNGVGQYPSEISWNISLKGDDSIIIENDNYDENDVWAVKEYHTRLSDGTYVLKLFDSYGDGWNGGYIDLYSMDTTIVSSEMDNPIVGPDGEWSEYIQVFNITRVPGISSVLVVIINLSDGINKAAAILNNFTITQTVSILTDKNDAGKLIIPYMQSAKILTVKNESGEPIISNTNAILAAMTTSDAGTADAAGILALMVPDDAAGILALMPSAAIDAILPELKAEGLTAKDLIKVGFSYDELLHNAVFSEDDLNNAATELKEDAEKHNAEMNIVDTAMLLMRARFTAAQLKAAGFTAAQLKAAGFTAAQLKAAGFTAMKLRAAQFTLAQLKNAKFSRTELKAAGFTDAELTEAGLPSSALGDPYITPVYGPSYKLPDRNGVYRYISNKAHYANRFSIDADVVILTKKQQTEALRFILEHDRKSVQAANGRLVLDGYFFRNYMLTNCGEKLLIDMEADTINGKSIRNIKTEKFTVSVGTEQAPLSYPYNEELNEAVYSLTIETFHETYGNIKVVLNKYINPQVRNGIHMHTEKKLTHKNSKGFIMHFQDYKQFSIRKLGSKQDIADFDKAKVPSMKKEVTEEFKYQNTGTKNLKFLQQ